MTIKIQNKVLYEDMVNHIAITKEIGDRKEISILKIKIW